MVNPQQLLSFGTALNKARPPALLPRPNALSSYRVLSPQFEVKRGDHALPPILGAGSDAFPSIMEALGTTPQNPVATRWPLRSRSY